ncbi:unnamed protein product [Caenorhabditis nigoni]
MLSRPVRLSFKTTTGLIMNYDNDIFQNVSIHFGIINGRSRIVGTLISTFLSSEKEVRFIFSGDNGIGYEQRYSKATPTTHYLWYDSLQASEFMVTSESSSPGKFYCQYFMVTGDFLSTSTTFGVSSSTNISTVIPTATVIPTSEKLTTSETMTTVITSTLETTTKSTSRKFSKFFLILIILLFC